MLAAALALAPILANVIPNIVGWFGGDDAEQVASQVVAVAQSVAGSTDPAVVAAVVADPDRRADLALGLARIQAEREAAKDKARLEEFKSALASVQDARRYNVDLVQAGSKLAWAPVILSTLVLLGFFAVILGLFVIDKRWDERNVNMVNSLFGTLTVSFGAVIQYWLGTARDSAAKDERQQQATALVADTARRVMDSAPVLAAAAATNATAEAARPLFNRG